MSNPLAVGVYHMRCTDDGIIHVYRPTGGMLPHYARESGFHRSYYWGVYGPPSLHLAWALLRHRTGHRRDAELWHRELCRDVIVRQAKASWGIHPLWLDRWAGPCAGLIQRAHVFWVPFGMVYLREWLARLDSDHRHVIAGMIADGVPGAAVDYVYDLDDLAGQLMAHLDDIGAGREGWCIV